MLYRELLATELQKKHDDFSRFASAQSSDLRDYVECFETFTSLTYGEIRRRLADLNDCGAVPSEEFNLAENFGMSFREAWKNHEEARAWALGVLRDRTTFAADGSQMFADREISLPVGAVQIGWFENPHDGAQNYTKQASFHILSPGELLSADEPLNPETRVGQRRFEEEVKVAKEFLLRKEGWEERGERMPLAFFDGTLMLSIALPKSNLQNEMLRQLVELVRLSAATKVPIVGFVDRSYARDLMTMIDTSSGRERGNNKTLDDVTLLKSITLRNWGDRTPFCFARRHGLEAFIDDASGESIVGVVYLRTTGEAAPARVDVPAWVYEEGLLDEVVDTVRAECVVGLGYPYAIETADQAAVISLRDRDLFLQTLQNFARENNLSIRVSRKAASKGRRR